MVQKPSYRSTKGALLQIAVRSREKSRRILDPFSTGEVFNVLQRGANQWASDLWWSAISPFRRERFIFALLIKKRKGRRADKESIAERQGGVGLRRKQTTCRLITNVQRKGKNVDCQLCLGKYIVIEEKEGKLHPSGSEK